MPYNILFSSKQIGTVCVKNRLVMPAMGTGLAHTDGTVSDEMIAFYEERAKGGAGLIITEVTMVNPNGRHNPWQIAAFDDSHIPGLTKLAERVHQYGCKIFLQLYHPGCQTFNDLWAGRCSPPVDPAQVHAPSGMPPHDSIRDQQSGFGLCRGSGTGKAGRCGRSGNPRRPRLSPESIPQPLLQQTHRRIRRRLEGPARIVQEIVTAIRERSAGTIRSRCACQWMSLWR